MAELVRVSFTIEDFLLKRLEELRASRNAPNRSEFIRDLIRNSIVEEEWEKDEEALGTITLIYDHHARQLSERLVEAQHEFHDAVLATTHVHLDRHLCAEMIMVRGRAGHIRALADRLHRERGVLHAALSMSSTGQELR